MQYNGSKYLSQSHQMIHRPPIRLLARNIQFLQRTTEVPYFADRQFIAGFLL